MSTTMTTQCRSSHCRACTSYWQPTISPVQTTSGWFTPAH